MTKRYDEVTKALVVRIILQERVEKNRDYEWLGGQLEHMLFNNGLRIRMLEQLTDEEGYLLRN